MKYKYIIHYFKVCKCERCKAGPNSIYEGTMKVLFQAKTSNKWYCSGCIEWLEENDPDFGIGLEATELRNF